jgi:hypothetical protein
VRFHDVTTRRRRGGIIIEIVEADAGFNVAWTRGSGARGGRVVVVRGVFIEMSEGGEAFCVAEFHLDLGWFGFGGEINLELLGSKGVWFHL